MKDNIWSGKTSFPYFPILLYTILSFLPSFMVSSWCNKCLQVVTLDFPADVEHHLILNVFFFQSFLACLLDLNFSFLSLCLCTYSITLVSFLFTLQFLSQQWCSAPRAKAQRWVELNFEMKFETRAHKLCVSCWVGGQTLKADHWCVR